MPNFFLDFRGYWRNAERDLIPNLAGIFCVYRCCYDFVKRRLVPSQLLYVGESLAARDAIYDREARGDWERLLRPGEELGFSIAPLVWGRERAAAAMVFRHKPPENNVRKHRFPFPPTSLTLSGKIHLLDFAFSVPDPAGSRSLGEPGLPESNEAFIEEDEKMLRYG